MIQSFERENEALDEMDMQLVALGAVGSVEQLHKQAQSNQEGLREMSIHFSRIVRVEMRVSWS